MKFYVFIWILANKAPVSWCIHPVDSVSRKEPKPCLTDESVASISRHTFSFFVPFYRGLIFVFGGLISVVFGGFRVHRVACVIIWSNLCRGTRCCDPPSVAITPIVFYFHAWMQRPKNYCVTFTCLFWGFEGNQDVFCFSDSSHTVSERRVWWFRLLHERDDLKDCLRRKTPTFFYSVNS